MTSRALRVYIRHEDPHAGRTRFRQLQLVDVREPVEQAEAHIAGAKLFPLGQIEQRATEISRDRPVVVMCQAGKRGQTAAEELLRLGFTDVRILEGGMSAWKTAGLACAAGGRRVVPLMRQVQVQITNGICMLAGSLLTVLVDPRWAYLPMFFGAGLVFSGITAFCGLAMILAKMP